MEETLVEKSLAETLGLEETYVLVHETEETEIYAHTIYYEVPKFDYEQFVTEDDTPVDNLFSEAQQRLYIDPLHANKWTDRPFMACSNVGIYYAPKEFPVVPDMFLSFDVSKPKEWHEKKNKCYFLWRMKKSPELVLEIVSNKEGNENTTKFGIYAKMGVLYYIIHDPYKYLYKQELNIFQLVNGQYEPYQEGENGYMPEIDLGLLLWEGVFEGASAPFVRWCDKEGLMLRTGAEGIAEEEQRAKEAEERAQEEAKRADEAEERANALEREKQEADQKAQEEKERANALAREKQEADQKAQEEKERADALAREKQEAEERVQSLLKRLKEMGLEPVE
jgi:Uma2 family endonuclease